MVALGVLLLGSPTIAFVLMRQVPGWDPVILAPAEHFYIVSAATLLSAVIGAGLMLSVESLRHTRSVFLALGFVAIALIFATHGLGTPGFIQPAEGYPYAVVVSGGLSTLTGSLFIAASVLPRHWIPAWAARSGRALVMGALALVGCYVAVALLRPGLLDVAPRGRGWDAALATLSISLLTVSALRYYRAWQVTRFPAQMAMVVALLLLAQSQLPMYFTAVWSTSWWTYHVLMLASFLTLVGGWVVEAKRSRSLVLFSRALALRDELERADRSRPESLERLETAMSGKDEYTRHHMGRVSLYAVAIARELRLDPLTVELVEAAGRIHDIGKIAVPDAVLLKPGVLTPREFEQMKHHAERGAQIALMTPALAPVAPIIRAHHERFSGGGYPNGLDGDRIPLAARIVSVADTFDALTSNRSYRTARPLSDATRELQRVRGTQLDPRLVDAFLVWLEREGGYSMDELLAA